MRPASPGLKFASILALAALLAGCAGTAQQLAPNVRSGVRLQASATESVIYAFNGEAGDGDAPYGSPILDSKGAVYGTSSAINGGGPGVVWKLTPSGSKYKESAIFKFPSKDTGGATPLAALIMDSAGTIFGTASTGGKGSCPNGGCGVVFALTPSGGTYKETILHYFGTAKNDGTTPFGTLLLSGTELYGTASYGGTGTCTQGALPGCGIVFKVSTKGAGFAVLYSFKGSKDGSYPGTGLTAGKSGVLFGTTNNGGSSSGCGLPQGCGIAFELKPKAGKYTESVIYTFQGGKDGEIPGYRGSGMYMSSSGTLLGTAQMAGGGGCSLLFLSGCGAVFALTPKSGGYTESTVYDFAGSSDGQWPFGGLIDVGGTLYGTTSAGGGGSACSNGCGTVFALTGSGSSYTESVVYAFQGGSDGANVFGTVAADKSGDLFGTTNVGGGSKNCFDGCGSVFEIKP